MSRFSSNPKYKHGTSESIGILLVNLGTPRDIKTSSIRSYLKQFLSDPRVIEIPRLLWWLILHFFILPLRPRTSSKAYKKIWTEEGSPLLCHSNKITEKLNLKFKEKFKQEIYVELAMSYGEPSISNALNKLHDKFVRQILLLPMYPQYSNTTSGSVYENVCKTLFKRRWIPEFRYINHYHDDPKYIKSIMISIDEYWDKYGRGEKLLFSFHGLPKKMLLDGDPYYCQCQKTARLIANELKLKKNEWFVSFQSRLGRTQWLEPYTDQTLIKWGKDKTGTVDVICPGFAVDCLETLEEIAIQNNELFINAGGVSLRYIPALNESEDHISFLCDLIEKNISDWIDNVTPSGIDKNELQESYIRATQKGANE